MERRRCSDARTCGRRFGPAVTPDTGWIGIAGACFASRSETPLVLDKIAGLTARLWCWTRNSLWGLGTSARPGKTTASSPARFPDHRYHKVNSP